MSEYTPDEFAVRGAYNYAGGSSADSDAILDAEFDRFIARVKAEAQVEALRTVASRYWGVDGGIDYLTKLSAIRKTINSFADRIEREAGL